VVPRVRDSMPETVPLTVTGRGRGLQCPSLKQDVEAPESSTVVTAAEAVVASAARGVAPTVPAWTGKALSLRLSSHERAG